jgi:hypothetical protein
MGKEMEVRFARTDTSQLPRCTGLFAALISALGTERFELDLMNTVRALFGCEHITIFTRSGQSAPNALLAANVGPSQIAPDIAKKYLAHYWRLDPVRGVETQSESTVLVEIEDRDIDHSEYRRDCYLSAGLGRRLSILNKRQGETIQINISYGQQIGTAQRRQRSNIFGLGPVLHNKLAVDARGGTTGVASKDTAG